MGSPLPQLHSPPTHGPQHSTQQCWVEASNRGLFKKFATMIALALK